MKSIIYLLCACWIACLLSTGCKHFTDYEKSPSVQLTTLIQDSIIRYKPQEAEMLLAKAKQQAQDSTEYYYAEAVHSSLLMTRQQEDSAFYYINRCEKFCLSLPKLLPIHYLTLGIAENNKASLLENSNHPLSAKTAYEKAIQYYQRGNMHKRLPNVYNNLGYVYYTLNDLPMQAYCYKKALFICDPLSLPQIYRDNSYFMLAFCYVQLKNYPQAHYYLNKVYPQINDMPLYNRYFLLNTFVNFYYYQKKYEESWSYLMKIFDEVAQHQNDMPSEYATLEANYADLSIKLNKDLNKAKDYLQKAKAYFQSTKVAISIYYIMTMELELALKQNDLQTAASLVQQISHDSTVNVPINYQQRRNDVLTEYYKRTGNYSKALAILAAQLPIEDSIRSEEHNNYVAELDLRYKNDTTHLKNRITITNQKNEIKTLQLEIALGVILILGLVVYFIEYKRRVKKNQQQEFKQHIYEISKLKMQNIREKISPHFLFNVLNNEINQHPESTSEHQRLIRLTRLLRKGLDLSNRFAIPLSEELDFVSNYVALLQDTGKQFTFSLHKNGNVDDLQIPSMMIQIPVENAIKHGFANLNQTGHIDLIIEEACRGVTIHINNNGHKYSPFAPSNNKLESTGTGLRIIYQSIQLLNTHNKEKITFQILPGQEEGTAISIFIPYQYSYEWQ
jgi:tetratricopeptide (TPR) repeat protein